VAPNPDKVEAMLAWPIPITPTALQGFLGLTGFYHKFIKGYATMASPLTTLLRKDQFCWSPAGDHAFQHLKTLMTQAPVLATPNFSISFTIETDVLGSAIRVVLL